MTPTVQQQAGGVRLNSNVWRHEGLRVPLRLQRDNADPQRERKVGTRESAESIEGIASDGRRKTAQRMNYAAFVLLVSLFAATTWAKAQQDVAGIRITHPHKFQAHPDQAAQLLARLPEEVQKLTKSMEIYTAKPVTDLGQVWITKMQQTFGAPFDIDESARQTVQSVLALPGMKSATHKITSVSVSGLDARRVTLEADRYGGRFGAEAIIIYHKRRYTLWQVQILFGKERQMNPFASKSLSSDRARAEEAIRSVEVISNR